MQARGRPRTALLGCSIPDLQRIGSSLRQWSATRMLELFHVSQMNVCALCVIVLLYVVRHQAIVSKN